MKISLSFLFFLIFISLTKCKNSNSEKEDSDSVAKTETKEMYEKMKTKIFDEYSGYAGLLFLKHNIDSVHHKPIVENYIELFTDDYLYLDLDDTDFEDTDFKALNKEKERLEKSNVIIENINNIAYQTGLSSSVIAEIYLELDAIVFRKEFNYEYGGYEY
jgi:hypothetical protein